MEDSHGEMSRDNESRITQTEIISYIITAVWVVSFFVDIVAKGYQPPPTVHALMMLVAGALFGDGLIRRRNTGNQSPPTLNPPPNPKAEERGE